MKGMNRQSRPSFFSQIERGECYESSGKTVLVTGGATGIGLALAEAFLAAGNRSYICGRRKIVCGS
jgi:NADPH:quinone reductase-like Zn-dependent oxidoreductase